MRDTLSIIRNYLLNGAFAYALFGLYAVTVAPIVTHFIDYEEKSLFICIFGFIMLIAEFFALNFKLKMVRMRAEERRITYKKETGIDIIPSVTPFIFFGFFMRLVFRVAVVMIATTALGYPCTDKIMSPQGVIVLMTCLVADMCGSVYIYFNTNFYSDPPQNRKELQEDVKEEDDWYKANLESTSSLKYFRLELVADITLQVYALMLYTAVWKYINEYGIRMLYGYESGGITNLFLMLTFVSMLGLIPIRIAYWIEDSLEAITTKEKIGMWAMFFIVAFFTCSPVLIKYHDLYVLHSYDPGQTQPWYVEYLLTIAFFLLLLLVQIFLFGRKKTKE